MSSTFDMKAAVMSILLDEHPVDNVRRCTQCNRPGVKEKMVITDTKTFLIVQLLLFDNEQKKLPDICTPLQNFEKSYCEKISIAVHH